MTAEHAPRALGTCLSDRRVVACLGAGGVGKTTMSAAVAVGLCSAGRRVLCLTIDPARRLADSLGISPNGATEREVPAERLAAAGASGSGHLHVSLLDAAATFAQVVRRSAPDEPTAERVLSNRLFGYLSGSLPGVQEVMALERLFAAREDPRFDVVVLDTPPTAHALDFLDAPRRLVAALDSPLSHWLTDGPGSGLGAAGGRSMRFVLRLLARLAGPGLLEEMSRLLGDARALLPGFRARALDVDAALRSREVAFVLVTSVQPQAIDETALVHDHLAARGRRGDVVVVNRVRLRALGDGEGIGGHHLPTPLADRLQENLAQHERLAEEDELELRRLMRRCGALHRYYRVPAFASDVRDLAAVAAVARALFAADAAIDPESARARD
ncbi:MAG: ArsA family ATPase [Deltaproteobacteria bacterium]|nr:ArsA family ATPase [Deltaproteobacteria bacterium]